MIRGRLSSYGRVIPSQTLKILYRHMPKLRLPLLLYSTSMRIIIFSIYISSIYCTNHNWEFLITSAVSSKLEHKNAI